MGYLELDTQFWKLKEKYKDKYDDITLWKMAAVDCLAKEHDRDITFSDYLNSLRHRIERYFEGVK